MSKIMKVVYKAECSQSKYSPALGVYEEVFYMGEDSHKIGEKFASPWIKGEVTKINWNEHGDVVIEITPSPHESSRIGMIIPYHMVCRVYYGEG